MVDLLKWLILDISSVKHIIVVNYRYLTGRFYVFHDRPWWFVSLIACHDYECTGKEVDETINNLIDAAKDELLLRKRQETVV